MNWYYRQKGQTLGPVSENDLDALVQNGTLSPETFIWQKGMAQWQRYREVRGVAPAVEAAVPEANVAAENRADTAAGSEGWYYVYNDQTCGPVGDAELDALVQNGSLGADTFVWRQGMSEWQAYSTARGLAQAPPAQPAPAQGAQKSGALRVSVAKTAKPAAAAAKEAACMKCGQVMPTTHLLHLGQDYICMNCHSASGRPRAAAARGSSDRKTAAIWAGAVLLFFGVLFVLGLMNETAAIAYHGAQALFGLAVGIMVLVAAFQESVGQGFLTLCVPCYALYFVYGRCESDLIKLLFAISIITGLARLVVPLPEGFLE